MRSYMFYLCSNCGNVYDDKHDHCPNCGGDVSKRVECAIPVEIKEVQVNKPAFKFSILFYGIVLIICSLMSFTIAISTMTYMTITFVSTILFRLRGGTINLGTGLLLLEGFLILFLFISILIPSIQGMKKGIRSIIYNTLPYDVKNDSFDIKKNFMARDKLNLTSHCMSMLIFVAFYGAPVAFLGGYVPQGREYYIFVPIALLIVIIYAILTKVRQILSMEARL